LSILPIFTGRPNPVPNDDLTSKDLDKYEENHNDVEKGSRIKRHRRVRGPEDPDDQDVLDELEWRFHGIHRRNRDIHPHRESIFEKFLIEPVFSNGSDESK